MLLPRVSAGETMALDRDRYAHQPLDVPEISPLARIAEGDRPALGTGSRGPADPMHVALGLVRQLIIDDMRDARHVDAARRDVGGDEDAGLAVAERLQSAGTGVLPLSP